MKIMKISSMIASLKESHSSEFSDLGVIPSIPSPKQGAKSLSDHLLEWLGPFCCLLYIGIQIDLRLQASARPFENQSLTIMSASYDTEETLIHTSLSFDLPGEL